MATTTELQARITELEAMQAQAEVLNQISLDLNTVRDADELLRIMARPAVQAGASGAALLYVDLDENGEPEWTEMIAAWQTEGKLPAPVGSRFYLPEFSSSSLWMSRPDELQLITDVTADERISETFQALMAQIGVCSTVIIPLAHAGRWVGVVAFGWAEPREFSQQEAKVYHALIAMATPVVENVRLLDQMREILPGSEMLYDITRGLNVVRDDDELLQILAVPGIGAGARNANMFYVDLNDAGEPEWIEMAAAWRWDGTPSTTVGERFHLSEYPFTRLWLASPDESQLIADISTDERVDENSRKVLMQRGRRALAVVPLTQAGRWVGIVTLGWDEPHVFGKQEKELYRALTGLVTPAVENRRLLIEMQKAQARSEMLYAISRSMSAARDEFELLEALVQPILDTSVSHATLMYVDTASSETGEPEWLEIVATWGADDSLAPENASEGARYYLPEFPFSRLWMGSPDEPVIIPDFATIEGVDENFRAVLTQMDSRAMVVVPLARAGRWVGIVNIHWTEPREFGEQEIELYRTLMGLATPTVESRRLLIEKERAVVETLYVISRGLNVARDEEELLQILSQPAIEAGAFLGTLMYIDLDEAGDPEWLEMAASWQLGGTPTVPIGARFRLAEFPFSHLWMASPDVPQLIDDVKTDERLDKDSRNMLTSLGIQATAIIPLNHAGRWVGLIVFNWGEPHEFSPQEAEIYDAVDGLAAPTVESRRLMDNLEQMVARRTGELDVFRELAENAADGIWLVDLEGCLTFVNKAEASIYGYDQPEEMVGLMFSDVVVAGELEFDRENTILSDGWRGELHLKRKDGSHFWAEVTTFGITDKDGQATVIAGITRDVTARKQDEAERERLQQEVIEAQQGALRELSSPIIPVMERILIMPIIGSIDDARARDITRALLAGIQEHRAKVVIMDITGVSVVDSGVAEYLNRTIQAARLKGASAIITGISDAVAETIVDLGIDWSDVDTVNNLQTGLVAAMNRLGVRLTR